MVASVSRIAYGFDPGIGILHTDKRYRGSLAHDLMEPARPLVDGMVLDLLDGHALERADVYERVKAYAGSDRPWRAGWPGGHQHFARPSRITRAGSRSSSSAAAARAPRFVVARRRLAREASDD